MDTGAANSRRGEAGTDNERAYLLKHILICVLVMCMGGSAASRPGLLPGGEGGGAINIFFLSLHFILFSASALTLSLILCDEIIPILDRV